ncbi:RNA-guided endonuclease InsQ/TnpB family protein [Streptomyces brasiliensis]|uniref:Cas12f1-like TNB domain-containing protein n=1 Tax=Streptomyces brasiliensis TaxID=1954 RepID=A0A917P8P4_9ACTN|nr:transposase [Streptomyces brasiliensis]GGJ66886.1 hypothetical protein GCM10010121_091950 [Streptomyces brasiliensis]
MQHRVANLRQDALHKLTTAVASEYRTLVVEDLNVAGTLRNRRLARRIADAGFGEIRRQLTYKTRRNGCRIVADDRWFPSSKTCSGCGAVKAKLRLHIRTYECGACGLVIDRHDNAARNLAPSQRHARLVPEWPETRTQSRRRSLVEPTGRPAPLAMTTRPGRGGQVAQPCRTSGRHKRETVLEPKPSRFGDVTDLPGRNARDAKT